MIMNDAHCQDRARSTIECRARRQQPRPTSAREPPSVADSARAHDRSRSPRHVQRAQRRNRETFRTPSSGLLVAPRCKSPDSWTSEPPHEVMPSRTRDSPGLRRFLIQQGLQDHCYITHIAENYKEPDAPAKGKGRLKHFTKWLQQLSFLEHFMDDTDEPCVRMRIDREDADQSEDDISPQTHTDLREDTAVHHRRGTPKEQEQMTSPWTSRRATHLHEAVKHAELALKYARLALRPATLSTGKTRSNTEASAPRK